MAEKRKDKRGRVLRTGESQRHDGSLSSRKSRLKQGNAYTHFTHPVRELA